MNLSAMDLNLLVVLDALLTEQSVSRAAKRLNSTQPAVSRALGRLRVWFGDPLLTRTRHGMVPTPAGLALVGEVRAVLERIQGFVERRDVFDPARSGRTFRMTMSEYPQYLVCAPLLQRLAATAPGVSVEVLPWSLSFPEALDAGTLDLAICPRTTPVPGLHAAELLTDDLVVILRRGHPAAAEPLTPERYAALSHVVSAPNGRAGSLIDDMLEAAGLSRHVVLRVPSIIVLPPLVAGSDCCATVPRRLVAILGEAWDLAVLPLPLQAPAVSLALLWHDRALHDPGNAWLRGEVQALFAPRPRAAKKRDVSVLDLSRRAKQTL
ncbi:MAG: LysR family transcriptional regulator [Byssovorax sp.]